MKRQVLLSLATGALATVCVTAQTRFEGPQFGYLFDDVTKSVRVLGGVPGAASVDEPLAAEFPVNRAVVSRRGYALVQSKGGGVVHRLTAAGSRELMDADLWAVSPSGTMAALYSRAAGRVSVWNLEEETPAVRGGFDAPELKAIAVADDGTAAGITAATLVELSASGSRVIASGSQLTAAAYFPGSRDLVVADMAGKVIVSRSGATVEREAPVRGGLAVSRDGARVIVASSDGVWIWDTARQSEHVLACGCEVSEIRGVGRADVFHLAGDSSYPVLLDLTNEEPRLARVPMAAIRASVNDGGVK